MSRPPATSFLGTCFSFGLVLIFTVCMTFTSVRTYVLYGSYTGLTGHFPISYYVKQTVSEGCDNSEVSQKQTSLLEETVMEKVNIESLSGQTLFVGMDVHKKTFQVTLRSFD